MINYIKKTFSIRKGFITGVTLLVLSNILFIGIYYRILLNDQINKNYLEITTELQEKLNQMAEEIPETPQLDEYLRNYARKEEINITISDENNQEIKKYNESNSNSKRNDAITLSNIIHYQEKNYLITVSKQKEIFKPRIIIEFLVFEIVIVFLLTLTGIFGANIKILEPISSLSKDLNNYKLGIIPKKRKIHGGIDHIQNDFVDLVSALEEEKQKQNRIIASISHDIKTPLTSILGYSERLLTKDSLSNETKLKYANTIYTKALVMKEIVEEFDDYLSCNIKDENKTEKISIKYLVDYLNSYYNDDLKEKGIEFKVKTKCPNSRIEVDLAKLKRVFSNIIINSIRHFDKEKKVLNININETKDDKIIFEIDDNGCGCNEDLNKIFEPLYTTDKSRKISGLGLSICKEIIESHGGTIKASNNKLGGFSIIFTLKKDKED